MDYEKVNRLRQAQQERTARQSWDYLNMNSPQYPELASLQYTKDPYGNPISLSQAMEIIKRSNQIDKDSLIKGE